MSNRYCNLIGTNRIKDEYTKINDGFGLVEKDLDSYHADLLYYYNNNIKPIAEFLPPLEYEVSGYPVQPYVNINETEGSLGYINYPDNDVQTKQMIRVSHLGSSGTPNSIGLLSWISGYNQNNDHRKLDRFISQEPSTTDDYIILKFWVSSSYITNVGLFIGNYDGTTGYSYVTTTLRAGMNILAIQKSEFTPVGTPAWGTLDGMVKVYWTPSREAAAGDVYFDLIQMVRKDPSEDFPNPFQRKVDGVWTSEISINRGIWTILMESGRLNILHHIPNTLTGTPNLYTDATPDLVIREDVSDFDISMSTALGFGSNNRAPRLIWYVNQSKWFATQFEDAGILRLYYLDGTETSEVDIPYVQNNGNMRDPYRYHQSGGKTRHRFTLKLSKKGRYVYLEVCDPFDGRKTEPLKLELPEDYENLQGDLGITPRHTRFTLGTDSSYLASYITDVGINPLNLQRVKYCEVAETAKALSNVPTFYTYGYNKTLPANNTAYNLPLTYEIPSTYDVMEDPLNMIGRSNDATYLTIKEEGRYLISVTVYINEVEASVNNRSLTVDITGYLSAFDPFTMQKAVVPDGALSNGRTVLNVTTTRQLVSGDYMRFVVRSGDTAERTISYYEINLIKLA